MQTAVGFEICSHHWRLWGTSQVHQFDFCAAGGASGEANNEAVSKLAGVRPGHLLMAEWNNSVGRPCHYVAVDMANQFIVVAIRCRHPGKKNPWRDLPYTHANC
jgi:hypothetical protein